MLVYSLTSYVVAAVQNNVMCLGGSEPFFERKIDNDCN